MPRAILPGGVDPVDEDRPVTPTDEGLVRVIHRWDLVALAVNSIVGAGIFGLPSEMFRRTGVYSLLAFGVCAVTVTLVILCFAEVSSRFRGTGGPYLYARAAFGPLVGFEVGWMMWIARLTAFAANANLLIAYLGVFVPAATGGVGRLAVIVALVGGLAMVNLVGVRQAATFANVLTVGKLLPLALFVAAGLFFVQPARFTPGPPPTFGGFSVAVLLLMYAFSGFEMAVIPGGEARDPGRDMPRALLTAIGIVAVFYGGIQVVAIGTLPGLAASARPLADAAGAFLGPRGAALIAVGALVSILGNLNVTLLVSARLPFAMAERAELPRLLARTHPRFHTPDVAIAVTAALLVALTASGTFVFAATVSVIARLLSYGATCVALPVLRASRDAPPARFVVPAGAAIAGASVLVILWLLSYSTGAEGRDAALAALLGLVLYTVSRARGRAGPLG